MAFNTVTVVVCVSRTDGGDSIAPCMSDASGVGQVPMLQSILVPDPTTAAGISAAESGPDMTVAGGATAIVFGTIVGIYLLTDSVFRPLARAMRG